LLSIFDPRTSWRGKLLHAREHIERLDQACTDYRATEPFRIEAERSANSNEIAYRLYYERPIPDGLSLIVGDILHNLRSALDSFVYGLVEHLLGRALLEPEARLIQMPIYPHPEGFKSSSAVLVGAHSIRLRWEMHLRRSSRTTIARELKRNWCLS
jgi:hypothetical protein